MTFDAYLVLFRAACRHEQVLSSVELRDAYRCNVPPWDAAELNDEYAASSEEEVACA